MSVRAGLTWEVQVTMFLRRILFPIDFSEATIAITPYVREVAHRFAATVTILHSFNLVTEYCLTPAGDTETVPIPYTSAVQELREQRKQRLMQFALDHFAGVSHTGSFRDGDPAEVIQWHAQREKTDLIIMPTNGFGPFRRFLLGSITAKVLHDAPCPVLTSAHSPEPSLASPSGHRSIVCAVELNPEADVVVLMVASLFAQAYGARICLLHLESSSREQGGHASAQSLREEFEQTLLNNGSQGTGLHVTTRILDASIVEGIRDVAMEEAADLLVVGRGREAGNLSRVRSHLYTIIRESPCAVLSV